jgi:hypothetical protein
MLSVHYLAYAGKPANFATICVYSESLHSPAHAELQTLLVRLTFPTLEEAVSQAEKWGYALLTCSCRRGIERDNCTMCEGTGTKIDFAAIRAQKGGASCN